jgi:hypothetical protein
MNTHTKLLCLIAVMTFASFGTASAQKSARSKTEPVLKTYLIERDIPGAGNLTPADLKGISQKSCSVLKEMGNGIQWVQSYVTGNKVYCVYKAESESLLKEHASKGGFPITSIMEIGSTISPATASN